MWSRNPALGYPEHPPLVAWIIYAFTHIFGTNEFGTRFFFVLLIFFSGLLIYRITRHLYGTEEPAFFAAFLFHILPITQFAVLAKTDILFLFFFLLVAHAALQGDLILLALALGLTFLSKLLAPFVVLSVLLYFLMEKNKFWRKKEFIPALLVFLILVSPVVFWNLKNRLLTVGMRFGHQVSERVTLRFFFELYLAQFLIFSPLIFGLIIAAFIRICREKNALFLSFSVPLLLFFTFYSLKARAGIHWTAAPLALLLIKTGEMYSESGRKWFYHAALGLSALLSIFILYLPLFPRIIPANWAYSGRKEWVNARRLNELYGWKELGDEILKLYRPLEGPKFILVSRWGLGTLISFHTDEIMTFTIYEPTRNGRSLYLWEKKYNFINRNAVVIFDYKDARGKDPVKDFQEWFEKIEKAGEFEYSGRRYYFYRAYSFKKIRPHL